MHNESVDLSFIVGIEHASIGRDNWRQQQRHKNDIIKYFLFILFVERIATQRVV